VSKRPSPHPRERRERKTELAAATHQRPPCFVLAERAKRAQRRRVLLWRKQARSASAKKACPSVAEAGSLSERKNELAAAAHQRPPSFLLAERAKRVRRRRVLLRRNRHAQRAQRRRLLLLRKQARAKKARPSAAEAGSRKEGVSSCCGSRLVQRRRALLLRKQARAKKACSRAKLVAYSLSLTGPPWSAPRRARRCPPRRARRCSPRCFRQPALPCAWNIGDVTVRD
jgi:hypothetical protein